MDAALADYPPKFFQDGPNFYSEDTGELVASYPHLVKNDRDVRGAESARDQFYSDHPDFMPRWRPDP